MLSTTPCSCRTWLRSTDCLLSFSLSLFFGGPNRRYLVSRSKFLFSDLYTTVHRSLSQKSCSVLWRLKKKNPQWIGGPREEVSPKSSFSEVKGGLRGYLSVSHFLLFGLCALGEKVERAWGWFGWWGFQSAGFHLAQSISTLSLSFLTCKMMKSSFSSKTLIGVCTGLERGRWYVWLCVIVYACVW